MTNYTHLVEEQRSNIEYLLGIKKSFTYIAKSIKVDRTTIAKEIRRNRFIRSNFYEPFDKKGINSAIENCELLKKPPYVCNSCTNKKYCSKHKLYYNASMAQKNSDRILPESRMGVDISLETVEEIENTIVPLIKDKKQSVNQVYINHKDVLYFCKTTFYKYVDTGVLSLTNLDLPKKVKYKTRKKKYTNDYKRKAAILNNRTYEDFLSFVDKHPNFNICEMDTVEGSKGGKVFLTILIRDTKFMFIRLLDKKNVLSVNKAFDSLKQLLGISLFSRIFKIILTDNGAEFFNPLYIEKDFESSKKICNIFFCNPYSSYQKANIERNHEYIRRFFPKGISLNNLSVEQVQKLETVINNIPRNSLNGKSSYEKTLEKVPELINKLNYQYINPDNVSLSLRDIIGDSHEEK